MTVPASRSAEEKYHAATMRLVGEVEKLNRHRFVRVHNNLFYLIFWQFMRGLAFGLGSVVGATLLVSVLLWWLSQIEFLPIIGDWARTIIDEIKVPGTASGSYPSGQD